MDPHPQSQASLLALNENLRQEALSRKRAMEHIEAKQEWERLYRSLNDEERLTFLCEEPDL